MGGLVVTCAKCGMRQAFHGSKWENRGRLRGVADAAPAGQAPGRAGQCPGIHSNSAAEDPAAILADVNHGERGRVD